MNIVFFNTVKFWGGGEKLHFEYALKFKKLGHNVSMVVGFNSALSKKCKQNNIDIFEINLKNLSFFNIYKINKLKKFYTQNNIEAVIFSNSPDLKAGGLAAKKAKVKKIVYLRGLAVEIKSSIVNKYLFYRVLTHIVPNSYATKKMTLKNFDSKRLENKTKVIYHGIDKNNFENNNFSYKKSYDKIILGNAGRLVEQKGHKYLIEIAKILRTRKLNFEIRIAGEGKLKNELEQKIKENNLSKYVKLLGFVKDMPDFMKSIDIFLLSSLWEGFGYVIVEANIAFKPVIAFNLSSNPEIIKDKISGFLIDFPNIKNFADKIQLLAQNSDLYIEMAKNARKNVEQNFLIDDKIIEFEQYLMQN